MLLTSRESELDITNAAVAAATAVGIALPVKIVNAAQSTSDITWDKAPCRFCGAGCSVLFGTQTGKVVAIRKAQLTMALIASKAISCRK